MKDEIVKFTINCLQNEGLKFSVDYIATELKISKKTIYKYFATKENLAIAVYHSFYSEQYNKIKNVQTNDKILKLTSYLNLYCNSFKMVDDRIFNKFALNCSIKSLALDFHNELWEYINNAYGLLSPTDRIIIDGTLKYVISNDLEPSKVIERLANILC